MTKVTGQSFFRHTIMEFTLLTSLYTDNISLITHYFPLLQLVRNADKLKRRNGGIRVLKTFLNARGNTNNVNQSHHCKIDHCSN